MRGTPGHGSLMEWGILYREQQLAPDGGIDWEALKTAIVPGGGETAEGGNGMKLICLHLCLE